MPPVWDHLDVPTGRLSSRYYRASLNNTDFVGSQEFRTPGLSRIELLVVDPQKCIALKPAGASPTSMQSFAGSESMSAILHTMATWRYDRADIRTREITVPLPCSAPVSTIKGDVGFSRASCRPGRDLRSVRNGHTAYGVSRRFRGSLRPMRSVRGKDSGCGRVHRGDERGSPQHAREGIITNRLRSGSPSVGLF